MRRVMLAIALWLAPFDVFAQVPGGTFAQSSSAEATHIFKATPGALYSIYATNLTATAGFLVVVSSATVPADGAVTPIDCVVLPASGSASISYMTNTTPASYLTGVVAILTSATTCYTKTTGVITGFIRANVQ